MPLPPTRERRRTRAYLQLLRPANVATALADVLAGYAVAGLPPAAPLGWLLGATACLYAGGVVLNDVFDRHLDAVERPERPLPRGEISAATAGFLGATLLAAGVALASAAGSTAAFVALGTAAAIVGYDAWSKRHAFAGPVNMGLCRALNLMLGMAAAPAALAVHWPLGWLPLTYIAAVTMVSRGEVRGGRKPVALAALGLISCVLAGLAFVAASARDWRSAAWALTLVAVLGWRILPAFHAATRTPVPEVLRRAVRTGVLSLVLVDAVIAAAYADIIYSLTVLAIGLLALRLARVFAVT